MDVMVCFIVMCVDFVFEGCEVVICEIIIRWGENYWKIVVSVVRKFRVFEMLSIFFFFL